MMKNKTGFSLVELAIVLVIIGLITGGILTGQDLIRASELGRVASDINKYKVAVNTFKLKYNALPGDIANATSYWGTGASCPTNTTGGTCNGNGNGQIVFQASYTGGEPTFAWQHLALAGLISGSYNPNWPAGAVTTGTYIPTFSVSNLSGHITYNTPYTTVWYDTFGNHHYLTLGYTHTTSYYSGYLTQLLSCPELMQLDTKMDDGKPGTGTMHVPRLYCTTDTAITSGRSANYDPASTTINFFAVQFD